MSDAKEYQLKYVVIGCSGVGKTSILRRLVDHKFLASSASTIGIEFYTWQATVTNHPVVFNLWDTAGQERFYAIARSYFRNAIGIILVFDIADRGSFEKLSRLLSDSRAEADPNAVVMLVGNKIDLLAKREVTRDEAENYAEDNGLIYIESSAAEKQNIEEIFLRSAKEIVAKIQSGAINYTEIEAQSIPAVNFKDEEEESPKTEEPNNGCC